MKNSSENSPSLLKRENTSYEESEPLAVDGSGGTKLTFDTDLDKMK